MIYTDEVRKKLDAILKAFGEYIDGQSYFDIVYSKKIGYVWILAECPGDAGASAFSRIRCSLVILGTKVVTMIKLNKPKMK